MNLMSIIMFGFLFLTSTLSSEFGFNDFEQRDLEKLNPNIDYIGAKMARDAGLSVFALEDILKLNPNVDLHAVANATKSGLNAFALEGILKLNPNVDLHAVANATKSGLNTFALEGILKLNQNVDLNAVASATNKGLTPYNIEDEIKNGNFILATELVEPTILYSSEKPLNYGKENSERLIKEALQNMKKDGEDLKAMQNEIDAKNELAMNQLNKQFHNFISPSKTTDEKIDNSKNTFSKMEQKNLEKLCPDINYEHVQEALDAGLIMMQIKSMLTENSKIDLSGVAKAYKAGWSYANLKGFLKCKSDINFDALVNAKAENLNYIVVKRKLESNEL